MGVARARSGRLSLLNARGTQAGLTLLNSLGNCLGTLLWVWRARAQAGCRC